LRDSWKLVCVTPAGRRRYLRLLVPYVLACPDVDRYDLWVNTANPADLAFLEALPEIDPRIRLVRLPAGIEPGSYAIGEFWRHAAEPDSVYVRFDDDVVWLDPDFFDTLLETRLARRADFMVAPLVINNALSTYLLQVFGRIRLSRKSHPNRFDPVGWRNPDLPVELHRLLIELIGTGETGRLGCGTVPVSANSFSINCLSWFGADIATFGGIMPEGEDEEVAMSCTIPLRDGRLNSIETRAMAAHFAFYTQRWVMDATDLLDRYQQVAAGRPELAPWRQRIEALLERIEARYPADDTPDKAALPPSAPPRRSRLRRLLGKPAPRSEPRGRRQHQAREPVTVTRGPDF
jgi:hypothetical protein